MEKIKLELEDQGRGFGVRHLQALLFSLCATVLYMMRSSMGVAVLAMTDTSKNSTTIEIYEWSGEIRSTILSSFFWGYTIMQIPAGILAKRFGGKPLLLSALVINAALCFATPILAKVGSWVAVCLVRAAMGLTQACFMPSVHTLLGRWAPPQERTRISSIAYAGIQLGTIMTMPLCGVISQTALGWTLIFYTMGTLATATAVFWWGFAGSTPREHRWVKEAERDFIENSLNSSGKVSIFFVFLWSLTLGWALVFYTLGTLTNAAAVFWWGSLNSRGKACPPIPWRSILTSKPLYATAVVHIGMNWTFIMFLVQMPTYLKEALGIDLRNSSTLSALPFVGQAIVQMAAGFLSDYLYNNKYLSLNACRKLFNSIGCLGAGGGLIAMSFLSSEHQTLAVVVMTVTGGLLTSCSSGYVLNHIDLSPNFGGIMFGMTNCIANLFGILAPLSTGFILGDHQTDPARWRIVFFLAAGLIITGDMVFRFFGTAELQPWNEAASDEYEKAKEKEIKNNADTEKPVQEVVYSFQEHTKTN